MERFVAIVLSLMGAITAVIGFRWIRLAWSMRSWPATQGEVRSSQVLNFRSVGADTSARRFRPEILYAFTVDGQEYTGVRRSLVAIETFEPESPAKVVARYPVGQRVTVYYDPSNPRESILIRDTALPWAILITALGLFFSGASIRWLEHTHATTETALPRTMAIPELILPFAFMVVGALAAAAAFSQLKVALAMQGWPSTNGKIRSSRVVVDGTGFYKPDIEYVFTVGGREIVGTRRSLFSPSNRNRVWADTIVARYAAGSAVTVYYDPADPQKCIVDRGYARTMGMLMTLATFGFAAIGLVFLNSFTSR